MRRMRSLFLILIALWLPLQAAAAWTMGLCIHEAPVATDVSPCHGHDDVASMAATGDLDCDNCGICHLASTGFLLAGIEPAAISMTANVLVPRQVVASPSHISPPPQQPPRR